MTPRDDFSEPTKRLLAQRAGHRCSNPDCRAPTSGPQVNRPGGVNVGVAAHITAAVSGGPRFDGNLSPENRAAAENGIWLCQTCAKLVDNDPTHFTADVLRSLKHDAEREARAVVGKPQPPLDNSGSVAAAIRRNLDLRDRMSRDLRKTVDELRELPRPHYPYEEFANDGEAIIRSIEDKTYPEVEESEPPRAISGWFKVEMYDFYYNGLVVLLGLERGIVDASGNWRILGYEEDFDSNVYREIHIWRIGRIPWRNIVDYDMVRDEYYSIPHIYCRFADSGMPYEDIVFAMHGKSYDWLLEDSRRLD